MAGSISGPSVPQKRKSSLLEFTTEEKHLAREAWMQVECNYANISKGLFTELFRQYPEFKAFFKELYKENSVDWKTPRFEKHMVKVLMPALGDVISNLDNTNAITAMMESMGRSHKAKGIGIKRKHVEILKNVFVETLKSFLGSNLPPLHEAALAKVFSAAFYIFEKQL